MDGKNTELQVSEKMKQEQFYRQCSVIFENVVRGGKKANTDMLVKCIMHMQRYINEQLESTYNAIEAVQKNETPNATVKIVRRLEEKNTEEIEGIQELKNKVNDLEKQIGAVDLSSLQAHISSVSREIGADGWYVQNIMGLKKQVNAISEELGGIKVGLSSIHKAMQAQLHFQQQSFMGTPGVQPNPFDPMGGQMQPQQVQHPQQPQPQQPQQQQPQVPPQHMHPNQQMQPQDYWNQMPPFGMGQPNPMQPNQQMQPQQVQPQAPQPDATQPQQVSTEQDQTVIQPGQQAQPNQQTENAQQTPSPPPPPFEQNQNEKTVKKPPQPFDDI